MRIKLKVVAIETHSVPAERTYEAFKAGANEFVEHLTINAQMWSGVPPKAGDCFVEPGSHVKFRFDSSPDAKGYVSLRTLLPIEIKPASTHKEKVGELFELCAW